MKTITCVKTIHPNAIHKQTTIRMKSEVDPLPLKRSIKCQYQKISFKGDLIYVKLLAYDPISVLLLFDFNPLATYLTA